MDSSSARMSLSAKERARGMKRKIIEVAGVPPMENLPSSLEPVAFARARTAEVLLLKRDISESVFRGSRRVFQTLPRHMRRRAASFNIRRLPTRLREKALAELAKNPSAAPKRLKKPPCRRRRRRPVNIQQSFAKRQQDKHWLSTHLWHAKRAHMETRWGYRIAVRANEKCRKACIRASRRGCLLHDRSYYEVLCVATAALGQLSPFLHPDDRERLEASVTLVNSTIPIPISSISLSLYAPTGDKHLMGPVEIIVGPMITALLVHPCIGTAIADSLTAMGVSVKVQRGEWAIFDLQGPQTEQLLHQHHFFVKYQAGDGQAACEWALDPRVAAGVDAAVAATLVREAGSIEEFWNCEFQQSNAASRSSSHQLDQRRAQLAVPGTKLVPTREDPLMPFLILNRPKSQDHPVPRITLIVHEQWGLLLWRALVFAKGTRFAGLEELDAVNLEALRPTFPQDFPTAPEAFAHHLDIYAARLEDKWKRTPPAKRINYQKLGIVSPFRLDLSLIPVEPAAPFHLCRIEMEGRGTPEYNARVYYKGRLIGLVTSGGYSQVYGKGIGFATCRLVELHLAARLSVQIQSINAPAAITRPAFLTRVNT